MKQIKILLTILFVFSATAISIAQSDCAKKYPIGALPDDCSCEGCDYEGNIKKYMDCLCKENERKEENKENENSNNKQKKEKKDNTSYGNAARVNQANWEAYQRYKTKLTELRQKGQTNTEEYKETLKLFETYESALPMSAKREAPTLNYLNKESTKIKFQDFTTGIVDLFVEKDPFKKMKEMERRRELRAKERKQRLKEQEDLFKKWAEEEANYDWSKAKTELFKNFTNIKKDDLSKYSYLFPNLKVLQLTNYQDYEIPKNIDNLHNLTGLTIHREKSKSVVIPSEFGNLEKLKTIAFISDVSGYGLNSFFNLRNLEHIELTDKLHYDKIPSEIIYNKNIKSIYLTIDPKKIKKNASYKELRNQLDFIEKYTSINVSFKDYSNNKKIKKIKQGKSEINQFSSNNRPIEVKEYMIKDIIAHTDLYPFNKFNTAPISIRGKFGLINKNGEVILPLEYTYIGEFSEGLARVKKDEKWGIIDYKGNIVIPIKYLNISDFSEGLAIVNENNKRGFINKEGNTIIPLIYDKAGSFSEGLAAVTKNGITEYINKDGEVILSNKFEIGFNFSNGLALVKKNDQYSIIDKKGNIIFDIKNNKPYSAIFRDDILFIRTENKMSFLNTKGQYVIPSDFTIDRPYIYDGLIRIRRGGAFSDDKQYGYINNSNELIIPFLKSSISRAGDFSEGLAFVYNNDIKSYGAIDKTGRIVLPFKYDNAKTFINGLAIVEQNGLEQFIDKKGSVVLDKRTIIENFLKLYYQ